MSDADFERVRAAQAERNTAGKKGGSDNQRKTDTKASMTDNFDTELYGNGSGDRYAGYNTSIPTVDEDDVMAVDTDDHESGKLV
ncbi:hypothetical protein KC365_g11685, partial [Hortaea werneckii]